MTFLVPNGWEAFNGTGICDPTDLKRHWLGRTHAAGGGWQVILDQHADMSTDAWRELQDSAGYRFTHSGRLSRIDGSSFTGAEAFAALDRVRLGLNLALGRRTTCALPVGWRDGKPVWCRWRSAPVDSSSSSHWLDETIACKQVGEVVSLMLDFTSDEANLAAVRPALAYYVAGTSTSMSSSPSRSRSQRFSCSPTTALSSSARHTRAASGRTFRRPRINCVCC